MPLLKEQDTDKDEYMNSASACTMVNIHIGTLQLSVFRIHSLLNIMPPGSDIILMSNINKIMLDMLITLFASTMQNIS